MSNEAKQVRRSGWRRWAMRLWIGAAVALWVLVVAVLLWFVGLNQWSRAERLTVLEAYADRGIVAWSKPAESLDAADPAAAALLAARALGRTQTAHDAAMLPYGEVDLEPKQSVPAETLDAMRATRELRERLLGLLDVADVAALDAWAGRDEIVDAYGIDDQLGATRAVARRISTGLPLALVEGDQAMITRTFRHFGTLERSLRGGMLLNGLVARSIVLLACGEAEDLLSRGQLAVETLEALANGFDASFASGGVDGLLAMVQRELSYTAMDLEQIYTRQPRRILRWYEDGQHPPMDFSVDPPLALPHDPPSLAELRGRLRVWAGLPDWTARGWTRLAEQNLAAYDAVSERTDAGDRLALWAWAQEDSNEDAVVWDLAPDFRGAVGAWIRNADRVAVTAAALRVEAYRLEHGGWPSDLAMAHGGTTPVDWAGRPLRLRLVEGDAWVYAVGANGVDDGGRSHWHFDDAPEGADDFSLFRLYAPGERGVVGVGSEGAVE